MKNKGISSYLSRGFDMSDQLPGQMTIDDVLTNAPQESLLGKWYRENAGETYIACKKCGGVFLGRRHPEGSLCYECTVETEEK